LSKPRGESVSRARLDFHDRSLTFLMPLLKMQEWEKSIFESRCAPVFRYNSIGFRRARSESKAPGKNDGME